MDIQLEKLELVKLLAGTEDPSGIILVCRYNIH